MYKILKIQENKNIAPKTNVGYEQQALEKKTGITSLLHVIVKQNP